VAAKYVCCQCDVDVTSAVTNACQEKPVIVATLTFKGMQVIHADRWVTVTCPNNHICTYPCIAKPS
jgi:hypothetical protein